VYSLGNQAPTQTVSLSVQRPTVLTKIGTDSTTPESLCGNLACGVQRTFRYQVQDQFVPARNISFPLEFWDHIQTTSNGCNLGSYTTTCPGNTGPCGVLTDFNGQFDETLGICAPACCNQATGVCQTGCTTASSQDWHVNGFTINKSLSYQCNRILVNGQ
jgi:hypothetical protein